MQSSFPNERKMCAHAREGGAAVKAEEKAVEGVGASRLVRNLPSSEFLRLSKPMRLRRLEATQDADGDMVYLCPLRNRLCVMDWDVGFRLGEDRLKHPESNPPLSEIMEGPSPHDSRNGARRQDHLDAQPAPQRG